MVELSGKQTSLLREKEIYKNKQAEMWAFLNLSFAKQKKIMPSSCSHD